ncbi:MAG TPA: PEGA domain-containing protein [Patescibacteria group bacterium]
MRLPINTRVFYTLISALVILGGAFLAIEFAKGNYRLTRNGYMAESGLLAANSFPTGAEIYVDGNLLSATDDTIYLKPGEYQVEIVKDGYWPWKKTLLIQKELVTQTNAQLFPIAPSLSPLSFAGVTNVTTSPDGQKLLYYVASASATTKNGLYVHELTDNFLSLQRGARQVTNDPTATDLSQAQFIWAPDSSQVMVLTPEKDFVLELNENQDITALPDISFERTQLLSEWQEEMYIRERQFMSKFPDEIIDMATTSAKNVYISPDKKRLLYTATQQLTLPDNLVPPVPSPNNQPQERALVPGGIYVYDREEDRNFRIGTEPLTNPYNKQLLATDLYQNRALELEASPSAFRTLQATTSAQTALNFSLYHTPLPLNTYQWFPDSKHVVYMTGNAVQIKGYDNTNDTTVYSGPFSNNFVYPWPDGSKLLILTSFNPETPANLYAIELK